MLGDGVLHGQLVQVELLLQAPQQFPIGIAQADPDHVSGLGGPLATFLEADISDFMPLVIGSGGNDLGHGLPSRGSQ
ncbi:hypothetical protein D3C78_1421560 [compost metagenome]